MTGNDLPKFLDADFFRGRYILDGCIPVQKTPKCLSYDFVIFNMQINEKTNN
jgi:hypothetical protein